MGERRFAKLQFEPNEWRLSSIEIWPTLNGRFFRIHYSEDIAPALGEAICTLPAAHSRDSDPRVGTNLDGDFLIIAANLAGTLRAAAIHARTKA